MYILQSDDQNPNSFNLDCLGVFVKTMKKLGLTQKYAEICNENASCQQNKCSIK